MDTSIVTAVEELLDAARQREPFDERLEVRARVALVLARQLDDGAGLGTSKVATTLLEIVRELPSGQPSVLDEMINRRRQRLAGLDQ